MAAHPIQGCGAPPFLVELECRKTLPAVPLASIFAVRSQADKLFYARYEGAKLAVRVLVFSDTALYNFIYKPFEKQSLAEKRFFCKKVGEI